MNKVIHAAVRRDLVRLEQGLDGVAEGDRARAADLRRGWDQLQAQLRHHHDQEETTIFPAVVRMGVDPALVTVMEGEHDVMIAALDDIDTSMRTYAAGASVADASAAAEAVRRGRAVVDRHLAHEEDEFEPLVRPYWETAEWKAVEKQLRKQPARKAGWFMAWIQDGASDEVRTYLRGAMPRPVLVVFSRVLGRGYHRQIAPIWGARPA